MALKRIASLITVLSLIAALCGCSGILNDETPSEATEVLQVVE